MIGHGREEVAEWIAGQIGRLEFAALDSGMSHDRVAELASRLVAVVPLDDPVSSFTSSGSEANDLAFKLARAYHRRRGEPGRDRILFRDGSYHGSTIAAVVVRAGRDPPGGQGPARALLAARPGDLRRARHPADRRRGVTGLGRRAASSPASTGACGRTS
jgi:4-aminobutyrate aminotransferase-like enzyme